MSSGVQLAHGEPVICAIDGYDVEGFTREAAGFGQRRYAYVVTPNTDHLVRLYDDPQFRSYYEAAEYVLLDSRVVSRLLRMFDGLRVPVCTGSEVVEALFAHIIDADDPVVLIGATAQQAASLQQRYGLRRLHHHNPPMGFMQDPQAVEACLRFVESHSPFRYCFLAVGSPRQEYLAWRLAQRGAVRGLALCVGAAIDFLTGAERRAPVWMRELCLEWLFRLSQSPQRLARRYLVRGPRILGILQQQRLQLRPPPARAAHFELDSSSRPAASKR